MSHSAEIQARLTNCLRDLVSFLVGTGLQQHSINLLTEFINKHQTVEILTLAESFGKCNAFIDQDALLNLLYTCWCILYEGYGTERKILAKKIKLLKDDKKADPEVLSRQENLLIEIDQKKSNVLVHCVRIKLMISISITSFEDSDFDGMHYAYACFFC
jgi:hypothetical protein